MNNTEAIVAELTAEEKVFLYQQGNLEMGEILLVDFKNTIKYMADRYYVKGGDYQDLIQEANIGFFKALRLYNPTKGINFMNYAKFSMKRQLISAIKMANRQKHIILNYSVSLEKVIPMQNGSSEILLQDTIEDKQAVDAEQRILEKESFREFIDSLKENLTELEYSCILMRAHSMSFQDIATILNKNEKAVDNALQRAKFKIERIRKQANSVA